MARSYIGLKAVMPALNAIVDAWQLLVGLMEHVPQLSNELFGGTITFDRTVPPNNSLLGGTVPPNNYKVHCIIPRLTNINYFQINILYIQSTLQLTATPISGQLQLADKNFGPDGVR